MAECRTALRLTAALSGGQGLTGLSVSGPEGTTCFQGRVCTALAASAVEQGLLGMAALRHAPGRLKHALEPQQCRSLCWDEASVTSQWASHLGAQATSSSLWSLLLRPQGVHEARGAVQPGGCAGGSFLCSSGRAQLRRPDCGRPDSTGPSLLLWCCYRPLVVSPLSRHAASKGQAALLGTSPACKRSDKSVSDSAVLRRR